MAALSKKLRKAHDGHGGIFLEFWCPGCDRSHSVQISGGLYVWGWDQNVDRPTFTPSILVSYYKMSPEGLDMIRRGERPPEGERYPGQDVICHSFVAYGRIKYLEDCTHELAGQTVELPDWTHSGE